MGLDDILENPAFWILGGLGIAAELIGYIISKKSENLPALPIWQLIALMIGTLIIAAIFASRD